MVVGPWVSNGIISRDAIIHTGSLFPLPPPAPSPGQSGDQTYIREVRRFEPVLNQNRSEPFGVEVQAMIEHEPWSRSRFKDRTGLRQHYPGAQTRAAGRYPDSVAYGTDGQGLLYW